jgi:serine/threonine-protein kinase
MRPESLIGRVLAQNFRIESILGVGGMGAVYRGRQLSVDREVAIKLLKPDLAEDPAIFARFRLEAVLLGRLNHRNIVQVIEFGERDPNPANHDLGAYLVMEMLYGEDLDACLARSGRLSYAQAAQLALEVGSALQAAHERGIVHRDIKPHNIYVQRHNATLAVDTEPCTYKVVDFGVSKLSSNSHTKTPANCLIGTPQYMSPEGAQGHNPDLDGRADQFSLAVVLYRALTGISPFKHADISVVVHRVLTHHPEPLMTLLPELPAHASQAVTKAMNKRREDRFASIQEFVDTFAGRPLLQVPLRTLYVPAPAADTLRLQQLKVGDLADIQGQLAAILGSAPSATVPPPAADAAPSSGTPHGTGHLSFGSIDSDLLRGLTPGDMAVPPRAGAWPPGASGQLAIQAVLEQRSVSTAPVGTVERPPSRLPTSWPHDLSSPTGLSLPSVQKLSPPGPQGRPTPSSSSLSDTTGQTRPKARPREVVRAIPVAFLLCLCTAAGMRLWWTRAGGMQRLHTGSSLAAEVPAGGVSHGEPRSDAPAPSAPSPGITPAGPVGGPAVHPAEPTTARARRTEAGAAPRCGLPSLKCIHVPGAPALAKELREVLRTEKVRLCFGQSLRFVRNPYTLDKRFNYDPPLPTGMENAKVKAVENAINETAGIPRDVDWVQIGCPLVAQPRP